MEKHPLLNKIILGVCGFLMVFTFTFFKDNAAQTSGLQTEVQVLQQQLDRLQQGTDSWLEILKVFRTELVHLQVDNAEVVGEIKLLKSQVEDIKRNLDKIEREVESLRRGEHG